MVSACGSATASDAGSTPPAAEPAGSASSSPESGSAEATGFPVSVTHKFGTTVIEQEPTRVVSAGYTEHDTLLALGVIPVWTRWFRSSPRCCERALTGRGVKWPDEHC